jgi:hypothetical protein
LSLPEFLVSQHFQKVRENKHRNQWPLQDLWLVMALAAVERARTHAEAWPHGDTVTKLPKKQPTKQVSNAGHGAVGN